MKKICSTMLFEVDACNNLISFLLKYCIFFIPCFQSYTYLVKDELTDILLKASTQMAQIIDEGNRTAKTHVLENKEVWKDGGSVDETRINLGLARRIGGRQRRCHRSGDYADDRFNPAEALLPAVWEKSLPCS